MIVLQETPLAIQDAYEAVRRDDCGAVAVFVGTVRSPASKIDYTAHRELAEAELTRIGDEAAAKWPGAGVYIAHRLGELPTGEASVIVAASTPHRAEAFEACRYLIEQLKQRAPIWKKEEGRWVSNR